LAGYKNAVGKTVAEITANTENMINKTMAAMGYETKQEAAFAVIKGIFKA